MKINPQHKQGILGCLKEISNSYARIEAERELVKEILEKMQEEFELPKKLSRKLARTYYKNNYVEEVAQQNDFTQVYETVTN
jgi:hypothetical protein